MTQTPAESSKAKRSASGRAVNLESMSVSQAADFLRLSPRRFRLLVDKGVITKAWGKGYHWETVLAEYLDYKHAQLAGGASEDGAFLDPVAERARKDKELADRVALQNAMTRGEQAPVRFFAFALAHARERFAAELAGLPEKLSVELAGLSRLEIMAVLEDRLYRLLDGFAHDKPPVNSSRPSPSSSNHTTHHEVFP